MVCPQMVNVYGAYTRLRDNSKSAMLAAIEIYNKPQIEYRDECFVVLLVNAWELVLKALLSKNRIRIYYPKKRGQDYRTLSIADCIKEVEGIFPEEVDYKAVKSNLDLLVFYRNNAIHYYNEPGFGALIYNLAQASIKNYADLLHYAFDIDLADEISIVLLPLSIGSIPLDPIQFVQQVSANEDRYSTYVTRFIQEVRAATVELEDANIDTARLMVTFSIKLESVKKISTADFTVAVDPEASDGTVIVRRYDPNNMLRQKEILEKLPPEIDGVKVNSYTFQAFVWGHDIKGKEHLCWQDKSGALTKYSPEIIGMIKKTTGAELQDFRDKYGQR